VSLPGSEKRASQEQIQRDVTLGKQEFNDLEGHDFHTDSLFPPPPSHSRLNGLVVDEASLKGFRKEVVPALERSECGR
jgi:hypothetical protein